MTASIKVIIVGGGIAGLTLANSLQHAGVNYVLLEGRSEIAPQVGASIAIQPNGARVLDQLDTWDEIYDTGKPLSWNATFDEKGNYIHTSNSFMLTTIRSVYPTIFFDRQHFLQILYNHIFDKSKILLHKRLSSVEHTSGGVTVRCEDGSSYQGDVLAGADGVYSKTRREMWRAADLVQPGTIPKEDREAVTAEYQCLFGISSPNPGLHDGCFHVTAMKDISTIASLGKGSKVYWFFIKKLDRIYKLGNLPRYTKVDAEAFAERCSDITLMPEASVTFADLWKSRKSYTLVPMEEAEYKTWTWGRIACLGDSIHKMTANAGAGGNASIESAAALANAIKMMADKSSTHPTMEVVQECLSTYQHTREKQVSMLMKSANKITRIHALEGLAEYIAMHYVVPSSGDYAADIRAQMTIGATKLEYLPPPERSLKGTMPFNPEQGLGKDENKLLRALLALPFLGLMALALTKMDASGAHSQVGTILRSGSIVTDSGAVSIPDSFYHINWLDELWRPITQRYTLSNLDLDSSSWWTMLTNLTNYGLLYSIFLIESARRANKLTLAQAPIIFGLGAQLQGSGVIFPIYYFFHYISTPIANFKALDMRLTDLSYTRSILPTMLVSFFIPHFMMSLHPSLSARHDWNWIWQMFPVWAMLIQRLLAYTVMPNTMQGDRLHAPKRDLNTIRVTVATFVVLSATVWLYTISKAPYSLSTLFLPGQERRLDWIHATRVYFQFNSLITQVSSMLWLGYLFNDLKRAGMVTRSWIWIMLMAALSTVALGPGATVGLGWLWREDVLANKRHKGAVVKGWDKEQKGMWSGRVANGEAKVNGVVANGHVEDANGVLH